MPITRRFTVYTNAGVSVPPVIHVNQYDRGETWIFTLLEPDGSKYSPASGGIVGIKADGHAIINTATVNGNGEVVVSETQQMTAAAGKAVYEIIFDNSTHGTANFIVCVEPKPGDNATLSDSDLSLIQEAIDSTIPANIEASVQDWMDDNLAPAEWVIDNTLSIAGAAADAKKVGDVTSELKTGIDNFTDIVRSDNLFNVATVFPQCRLQSNGGTYTTADYFTSDFIDVSFIGESTLWVVTGQYGLNVYYVCFYDENKSVISASGSVRNNFPNNTEAKYMRFSAQSTYLERDVAVNYGDARKAYTPYFEPYLSVWTDALKSNIAEFTKNITAHVSFGYSKWGSPAPTFTINSNGVNVYVDGFVNYSDRTRVTSLSVSKYNTTPETFSVPKGGLLYFKPSTQTIVVASDWSLFIDLYDGESVVLLAIDSNNMPLAGEWLSYMYYRYITYEAPYDTPKPVQYRKTTKTLSSYAGDQSICVVRNYLVNFDAQDSDGLIWIVNKDDFTLVKQMTHTLGHTGVASYLADDDVLLVDGYIIEDFYTKLENQTTLSPSDATLNLGFGAVFGESKYIVYQMQMTGAYDTIGNLTINRIMLGTGTNQLTNGTYTAVSDGEYNGTYEVINSYTQKYMRFPVLQDYKYHDGSLYACFGFGSPVVYKIVLEARGGDGTYKTVEAFNMLTTEADGTNVTYEGEGIIVNDDNVLITARKTTDLTAKYFVEML